MGMDDGSLLPKSTEKGWGEIVLEKRGFARVVSTRRSAMSLSFCHASLPPFRACKLIPSPRSPTETGANRGDRSDINAQYTHSRD